MRSSRFQIAAENPHVLWKYYQSLFEHLGPQNWWPARTRLEIILGAILVQNTAWRNAALAIEQLQRDGIQGHRGLRNASRKTLEDAVRPAGFYRQKANTILNFLNWLDSRYDGSLNRLFSTEPALLRHELLTIKGLGPETVDTILLYAAGQPFFVADAYTRRILARHGLVHLNSSYGRAQEYLHSNLPPDPRLFNEFHALLVETGKRYCRRRNARCQECPLRGFLPGGQPAGMEVP
jgi:endonuclease-3 related protein